jgi:hypothetical protein
VPFETVSVWPTFALPDTAGGDVLPGAATVLAVAPVAMTTAAIAAANAAIIGLPFMLFSFRACY